MYIAPNDDPRLLFATNVPDACRISGLSRSELYRRLAAGDISAVKAGRKTLILMDSLRKHIASLPSAYFGCNKKTTITR